MYVVNDFKETVQHKMTTNTEST